jgi:gliding motility-associated-like protein
MLKQFYILFFLFYFSFLASAISPVGHKRTFAQKDLFQTAVFLLNNGIINDRDKNHIEYYANNENIHVYFTGHGLIYRVSDYDQGKIKERIKEKKKDQDMDGDAIPLTISTVSMDWVGANPHPLIIPGEKANGYYTYLNKTSTGHSTITTSGYKTLTYKDIYPGIDVVYTFPDRGGIKYNLIVHPGADPSLIRMRYSGPIEKMEKDNAGNVTISTLSGDIIEHTPVCYSDDKAAVTSSFSLTGHELKFAVSDHYDHSKTLTIDPWVIVVTQLVVRNLGVTVDYNLEGEVYIYGPGAQDVTDLTNYHKVAKFDPNGNFLWVFNGSVPSIGWSSASGSWNYLSNAKVDKITGKVYVGIGFEPSGGTQVIRLDSSGAYDNFETPQDPNFVEIWSFLYNCSTGSVLALGGGTSYYLNMGVVNPNTAAISTSNFTTITSSYLQDIVSGAYDAVGNLYVVMASNGTPQISNTMFKVNSTYNGYIWNTPTGFSTLQEANNLPGFDNINENSNNFNGMAANANYLFYYDGFNLAAYNLATGAPVGAATSISGYNPLGQGGIAVDNCNHVYLGGQGVVKTFTFNGSSFAPGADISLGAGFTGDTVNDVRYNSSNNLIYVTGSQMVGTYVATLSTTCIVDTNTFSSSVVTPSCHQAIVNVVPGLNLTNPTFSFSWEDSAGNVLRQTNPGTNLIDTLTGIGTGHYTVHIQLNVNCGGSAQTDSFSVLCNNLVVLPDTSVCSGQPVTLTASPTIPGGTYLWSPGGATTQSITVSPTTTTTYIATYTPLGGGPNLIGSATVTALFPPTVSVNDTTVCYGMPATLTATPSTTGGTYSWTPGGAATQSITVSPVSGTTYTVVYSQGNCGTGTGTGRVTVTPAPTVSVANDTACLGNTATLTAIPSTPGGTYIWSPGGAVTQSITVSLTAMATYTVAYTAPGCNPTSGSGTVIINNPPSLSVNDTITCQGNATRLKATPTVPGGTYSWSPGGAVTQAITVTPPSTTTYTVTYIIPGCVAAVDSGTVSVTIPPVVTINNDSTCLGQGATLTATPTITGGRFFWFPGNELTQSITVNPPSTTNYTVTYIIPGSVCGQVTAVDTVTILPPPTLSVNNTLVCLGDAGTLTVTPSEMGGTYNWSPGGNVTQSITVSPSLTSTYRVTYAIFNCPVVEDSGTVTVVPLPTVAISIVNAICTSANGEAIAQAGSGTSPYTYLWSNPLGTTTSDLSGLLANSSYTVTVTDLHHCTVSASALIGDSITPIPISDSLLQITCHGLQDGYISVSSPGCNNCSYQWSNGSNTTSISNLAANTYSLLVRDQNGCTAVASYTINDPPLPSLTILPYDTTVVEDSFVRFIPLFGPYSTWSINSYSWTPAVGLSCTDCAQPVFDSVSGDYTYTLLITYNNTCLDSTTITVIVINQHFIYVPNAFTPNGDGVDDVFYVFPRGEINFLDLKIFDRWGEKVFETHDLQGGWDGRYRGQLEDPGVFVYLLTVTFDDKVSITKHGSISLIR